MTQFEVSQHAKLLANNEGQSREIKRLQVEAKQMRVVLLSSFTVDEHGGDGSLEPNHTYTRWGWYLARKNGGKWNIVTCGYG